MSTHFFHELADAYPERPFVVIGGGDTAAKYRELWPADAIRVAANEHTLLLGERHHYIVALDSIWENKIRKPWEAVHVDDRPQTISQHGWAYWQMVDYWDPSNSGLVAAWCSHFMGACPVILTGMDLYTGGTYHHDADAQSSLADQGVGTLQRSWSGIVDHCPGIQVRVLEEGPLLEVFPKYDPAELVRRPYPPPKTVTIVKPEGVLVKFLANVLHRGRHYARDQIARIGYADARHLEQIRRVQMWQ